MSIENGCDYYFSCSDCECSHCLVVKQRKEIKWLTEENGYLSVQSEKLIAEKAELQKQVDELKEERENMQAVIFGLEEDKRLLKKQVDELKTENTELYKEHTTVIAGSILQKKQAVKDTTKDILQKIMNIIKKSNGFLAEEVIRIMAKQKGVEVE